MRRRAKRAIPVKVLPAENDYVQKSLPFEHEAEKGSAFALGLLPVKVTSLPPFLYSIIVQFC
jgi:hypothetical protein